MVTKETRWDKPIEMGSEEAVGGKSIPDSGQADVTNTPKSAIDDAIRATLADIELPDPDEIPIPDEMATPPSASVQPHKS